MKRTLAVLMLVLLACAVYARADDSFENQSIARSGAAASTDTKNSIPPIVPTTFDPKRILLAMAVVVVLIFGTRMVVRRFFPAAAVHRSTQAVKILSRTPVSPRQHLLVVQVGKRVLVVGDSGTQLSSLCEIKDSDEVTALLGQIHDETVSAAGRFDNLFGKARKAFLRTPEEETPEESETEFDPTHEVNPAAEGAEITDTTRKLADLSEKMRDLAGRLKNS